MGRIPAASGQIENFINYRQPKPAVGMGATVMHYTDRAAHTVVRISKSGKTIWITRDKAVRTDKNGMSESQSYKYETDKDAEQVRVSLNKDGQWRLAGYYRNKVNLGVRDEYYDYGF